MLPKESTAGLATGCRLSAICTPMSQAQDSLACVPFCDHEFPGGGAFGHADDDERIGADDDGRGHVSDGHLGPFGRRKALPPDLQLAAWDGRRRSDLRISGLGSAGLRRGMDLIKIEPSSREQHKCGVHARHDVVG